MHRWQSRSNAVAFMNEVFDRQAIFEMNPIAHHEIDHFLDAASLTLARCGGSVCDMSFPSQDLQGMLQETRPIPRPARGRFRAILRHGA